MMKTRPLSLLRHTVLAAAALLLVGAPAAAAGERQRSHDGSGSATPMLSKPGMGGSGNASPSHVVNEGGAQRPLWLDAGRVAEFSLPGADQPAIRPAGPDEIGGENRVNGAALKSDPALQQATPAVAGSSAAAAQVSPVFLDAGGLPRALPGGVIVGLRQPLPDDQARELLQAAGLTPKRQIGERMWLVESPVGMESLHLANRLHGEGRFEFVQPNWWHPRTTK